MDKKRLDYYKKKLQTRREELLNTIARTGQEGREADEDPTVDLADKAANSYTKVDSLLHRLPGKAGTRTAVTAAFSLKSEIQHDACSLA